MTWKAVLALLVVAVVAAGEEDLYDMRAVRAEVVSCGG